MTQPMCVNIEGVLEVSESSRGQLEHSGKFDGVSVLGSFIGDGWESGRGKEWNGVEWSGVERR